MIQKLVNRFSYLDALIRKRATGCPKELAVRSGISERAWYKIRDELVNDLNVPLAYDSYGKTYYYAEEGELVFRFQKRLDANDMEKTERWSCIRMEEGKLCKLVWSFFFNSFFHTALIVQ